MKPEGHPRPADYLLLGVASAAVLSFEIILLRVFSFSQWHHFASLAVALALLGFGAAGTVLALLGKRAAGWGDKLFLAGLLAGAAGMVAAFLLPQWILVRPFFALWDGGELVKLLLLDFAAFLPFFGLAMAIGQVFVRWPEATPRLYGANLLGSGIGCLLAVLLLAALPLEQAMLAVPLILLAAIAAFGFWQGRQPRAGAAGLGGLLALLVWFGAGIPGLPLSDFKQLACLLDLPDARVLLRHPGLQADITVVRSDSIRIGRGLSVQWMEPIPPVDAAVLEADRVIPLPRRTGSGGYPAHAGACLTALPFELRPEGAVAVLGASDWTLPLDGRSRSLQLVESNRRLLGLFGQRGIYSGALMVQSSPRQFLAGAEGSFRLLLLAGISMGGEAADVDYLLTVEGLEDCLAVLSGDGVLAIPLRLTYPPRHAIRLMELLNTVLLDRGIEKPMGHLVMIRSMEDGLFLLSPEPFSASDIRDIQAFCERWSFDAGLLPGQSPAETNRFHILERPVYQEAAMAILGGQGAVPNEASWYSLSLSTDNRPHFWKSMRWSRLPGLMATLGRNGLVWLDWSILISVAKFCVALVLAAGLILLPLGRLPRGTVGFRRPAIVAYFGSLGLGFLTLEMVTFQRSILFFDHPVTAAAAVFCVFLLGAGAGSFSTPEGDGNRPLRRIFIPLFLSCAWGWGVLEWAQPLVLPLAAGGRLLAVAVALGPLAYCMGRPFPWGLRQLGKSRRHVAWAWGINGFASVLAAPLATLAAVHAGQSLVWLTGLACYLVAWAAATMRA